MNLAIMQPYFFPYLGYFQLIRAVDKFVFYDDVNFIKNGWINRNRVLINNAPKYMTVQLKNASPFKLINQVEFTDNRPKLLKTIQFAYKKAPYFTHVWPVIEDCLSVITDKVSELAIKSITGVCAYLGLALKYEKSSIGYSGTRNIPRTERILTICEINKAQTYINPIGGMDLYSKAIFNVRGLELKFLKMEDVQYVQYGNAFIPELSIIDVLMFNSRDTVREMLTQYRLV